MMEPVMMKSAYRITPYFVKTALPRKKEGALSSTLNPISYLSACCSRPRPPLRFAYLRLQQEQRRSRRILQAEHFSFEWKLANSAKTASKKLFAHVDRNKRMTACILQLRHPSGSLKNSNQEMAELLKTTFLGFFREDEGSTPVLPPRTHG